MSAISNSHVRHIILTGPPGIGKTTLVKKATEALKAKGVQLSGFYTEELRERGRRTGFDVVTLDGERGPLARIEDDGHGVSGRQYKVGQYNVKLIAFEQTALPPLRLKPENTVYVIDEIGKMELFSQNFKKTVSSILNDKRATVLATIPVPKRNPIPYVEEIRNRRDIHLYEISQHNRDSLVDKLVSSLLELSRS